MTSQPAEDTHPLTESEEKERKSLIKMLYQVSVDNIAQLKNRQWEVTKWVLAANLALLIPVTFKKTELATPLLWLILCISISLGTLAAVLILKSQEALMGERRCLEKYKERYGSALQYAYGPPKKHHTEFHYDWLIWGSMLVIAVLSSIAAFGAALMQIYELSRVTGSG